MTLNGKPSLGEELMIKVLKETNEPLTLDEIVLEIRRISHKALSGKTPSKSLYSTIYRREKRRKELGIKPIFSISNRSRAVYYALNEE
ncbi:hypothetical protein SN11_17060 [Vibrio harveyi]|nr:hypothetical protein SN11_17060 [Vibrio harveyi]